MLPACIDALLSASFVIHHVLSYYLGYDDMAAPGTYHQLQHPACLVHLSDTIEQHACAQTSSYTHLQVCQSSLLI